MPARLVVLNGPNEGLVHSFAGRLTIGRHHDNGLVLKDPTLSRRHLELEAGDQGCVLRDLGSRHGSFVNQEPVAERRLVNGDSIQLGNSLLLYLAEPAAGAGGESVAGSTLALPLAEAAAAFWRSSSAADAPREALLGLARGLLATRDPGEVGAAVAAALAGALPAELLAVLHLDPATGEWRWLHPPVAEDDARRPPPSLPLSLVKQFLDQEEARLCEVADGAFRHALVAPLFARGRQVGGLVLLRESRPFAPADLELASAVGGLAALAIENFELSGWRLPPAEVPGDHGLLGESAAIRKLRSQIERVARADATVLLEGESGSGKELVARAIHRAGRRAAGPWVVVNCATLSENLLESELFGHEKGSFTGALQRRLGKFETASGGTLFLDEVAEIPLALQAKLLRALQEREIERIGGPRPIAVDVRLVAASHRDLAAMCRAGAFREDLYYRLNVVRLELPPLRERADDIGLLARHFARQSALALGRPLLGLDGAARAALAAYSWPGNVRQLANVIERAAVLGDGELIRLEDLPDELADAASIPAGAFQKEVQGAKKQSILAAWREARGDYQETAGKLGIHVNSLHRLVRQLGLKEALKG